jgi:NAD(P)-dependent dehydrogenase (short-subunit alcohol dehydrogenase family)
MLSGKFVVVTGGANGIGRCIVQAFIGGGAYVGVIDKDKESGEFLKTVFPSEKFYFFHGDISAKISLESFVKGFLEFSKGKMDFLINNSCLCKRRFLSGCSYEEFEYVQRVGVVAPYYLTSLLKNNFSEDGCIVNIASTRALQSQVEVLFINIFLYL